ncbi:hypothetical protein [Bacillus sp. ISL-7]|uniref:hypothetical protein n=1 Tax=Bacillus sp. ISL-7 TaxID=2819136 RepID=UPI001BE6C4FD|nr:hypothetical protein [Bacillus sp. ISL-7]MBT2733718.1 hypothetical protein [Bacillus sp. ISL-7]
MMTYDEIEIGKLLKLEKTHKYEPGYIVQVIGKSVENINGFEAQFIVIEDPERPNRLIRKSPCLFYPYFEHTDATSQLKEFDPHTKMTY